MRKPIHTGRLAKQLRVLCGKDARYSPKLASIQDGGELIAEMTCDGYKFSIYIQSNLSIEIDWNKYNDYYGLTSNGVLISDYILHPLEVGVLFPIRCQSYFKRGKIEFLSDGITVIWTPRTGWYTKK